MRSIPLAFALFLAACSSPDAASSDATPSSPDLSTGAEEATPSGFDAQAWLAEAREVAVGIYDIDLEDDTATDRMKELAGELNEVADWRRICDTYLDYETGEPVYDPIAPGEGSWARGTLETGDISETEAVVAVTCDFGAYQGGYAFVHIAADRVALLTTPGLDENGQPTGREQGIYGTPDFSEVGTGFISTFAKARGLGDCGIYVRYAMGEGSTLSAVEVRQRDCGMDIPDDLPPPSEWPLVYSAG
ncbi:MAG: DUF1176 domain-containing protein [Bacteroidota bacterium]